MSQPVGLNSRMPRVIQPRKFCERKERRISGAWNVCVVLIEVASSCVSVFPFIHLSSFFLLLDLLGQATGYVNVFVCEIGRAHFGS